jgi:DNA-binding XRE family transcriptional regulator
MSAEGTLPMHPGWSKPTVALRMASPLEAVVRRTDAKLSYEQAAAIRELYATGNFTQQQLADAYGVTQPTICFIVRGLTHRIATPPARVARVAWAPARILTSEERIERWTAAVNATPSPLMDAKQAEIDERNARDAVWGGSAFHDRRP